MTTAVAFETLACGISHPVRIQTENIGKVLFCLWVLHGRLHGQEFISKGELLAYLDRDDDGVPLRIETALADSGYADGVIAGVVHGRLAQQVKGTDELYVSVGRLTAAHIINLFQAQYPEETAWLHDQVRR